MKVEKVKDVAVTNRLIAEFMGAKYVGDGVFRYPSYTDTPVLDQMSFKTLRYHTSWDWLMPVVEKIRSMGYHIRMSNIGTLLHKMDGLTIDVRNTNGEPGINSTYQAIIQFITTPTNR